MSNEFKKYATDEGQKSKLDVIVGRFERGWANPNARPKISETRMEMNRSFEDLEKDYRKRIDGMIQFYDIRSQEVIKK